MLLRLKKFLQRRFQRFVLFSQQIDSNFVRSNLILHVGDQIVRRYRKKDRSSFEEVVRRFSHSTRVRSARSDRDIELTFVRVRPSDGVADAIVRCWISVTRFRVGTDRDCA